MKGSPIVTTLIASSIMLAMYLCMHLSLGEAKPVTSEVFDSEPIVERDSQLAYAEIYFSSPPQTFTLSDPLTEKVILQLEDLTELEWSGDITIPKDVESLDLKVDATWATHSGYQFTEIVLSVGENDPVSATLRSEEDIEDVATFNWK